MKVKLFLSCLWLEKNNGGRGPKKFVGFFLEIGVKTFSFWDQVVFVSWGFV